MKSPLLTIVENLLIFVCVASLKISYASISNALSHTLQSTNSKSVVKYKQHLKRIFINKLVIEKTKIFKQNSIQASLNLMTLHKLMT